MDSGNYKIVVDVRMINHSGIGTYIKSMIPLLVNNYDLTLLGETEKIKNHQWADKVKVIECAVPIYSVREQIYLPIIIPRSEIFLSPHYNIPLLNVKSKWRAVIIHDVNHLVFYDRLSLIQKLYAKLMINNAVKRSDIVITISKFSKEEIKKYIHTAGKNIYTLYPCIRKTGSDEKSSIENIETARVRYNLPVNYLLYVGSIKPHKNFINLLKAYELVLKSNLKQKLVVVGISKSELKQDTEVLDMITTNDKLNKEITFTGYVNDQDMHSIYKGAACLVFPSLYEGFGLPPLEAMAVRCPVAASNSASIPEVCGDAVLYFDPKDYKSIYNSIITILTDENLSHKLIEKGSKNLDRFTSKKFVNEIQKILDEIVIN